MDTYGCTDGDDLNARTIIATCQRCATNLKPYGANPYGAITSAHN